MNNFTTDAINLKTYPLSEADKIVIMYSKDKGLIRGVAKGARKPKSKLGACVDLLIANNIMLNKGKNLDTIAQVQSLNTFKNTRKDLDKISYSMYITEIVNNFGIEDDPSSEEIYELLYKALDKISNAENKKDIMIAVIKFQLKMMLISGFGLELDTCLCCREQILDEEMFFSSKMGGVICKECNEQLGYKLKLHHKMRDFLQAMLQFDFSYESDYDKKATEKVCQVSFDLLKKYIESHSAKKFKSLDTIEELTLAN